jgi:hypothetical protein
VRILHVIHPASPLDAPWPMRVGPADFSGDAALLGLSGTIARITEHEHEVLILGAQDAARRTRAAGIPRFMRCAPPLGLPRLGGPVLRTLLRSVPWFDLIQFWGASMAPLACRVRRQRSLVLDLESGMVSPVRGGRLRGPIATAPAGLLRSESPTSVIAGSRQVVRTRLGISQNEIVVMPVADPPVSISAHPAIMISAILHAYGMRTVALLPHGARDLDRAMRHVTESGYVRRAIVVDEPLFSMIPACDLGVINEHFPRITVPRSDLASRILMTAVIEGGVPLIGAGDIPGLNTFDGCPEATASCARPADLAAPAISILDSPSLRSHVLETQSRTASQSPSLPEFLRRTWDMARSAMGVAATA